MQKVKSILKSNISLALCSAVVSILFLSVISGFRYVYSTNDDYLISWLIQSGEDKSLFINYFLEWICVRLQNTLSFVNWFCFLQLLGCVTAQIAMNYAFIGKFGKKVGLLVSFLIDISFSLTCVILIQWTHTTTFMCIAGFVLLLFSQQIEKSPQKRRLQLVFAYLLIINGALFRFVSFEICVLFVAVYCFCLLLESGLKEKGTFFQKTKHAVFANLKSFVLILIVTVIAFGTNIISTAINNADVQFRENVEFNSARSLVNDYEIAPYAGNEEFYNSLDIHSQEEIDLADLRHIDKDFFDTERMNKIGEYSSASTKGGLIANLKYAVVKTAKKLYMPLIKWKQTLNIKCSNILFVAAIFVLAAMILGVLIFVLLRLKKNQSTAYRIMLRIAAIAFVILLWLVYAMVFGINSENVMMLMLLAISVISVLLMNRYAYIYSFLLSLVAIGLSIYQSYFRSSFRVSFTIVVPAILLMIYSSSKDNVYFRIRSSSRSRTIYATASFVLAICAVCVLNISIWNNQVTANLVRYDTVEKDYINEHSEIQYFHVINESKRMDESYMNALLPVNYPSNAIPYGGWYTASESYEALLLDKRINHLFLEMINNPNRRFIISQDLDDNKGNDIIHIYEQYYNNHYAASSKTIRMVLEKELSVTKTDWRGNEEKEEVGIYRVEAN